MTSSTSASEAPRAEGRGLTAGLLLGLLLVLLAFTGQLALRGAGLLGEGSDMSARVDRATAGGLGRTVIMGSSVSNRAVDAHTLARSLPAAASPVTPLAVEGSGMAHWLAILHEELPGSTPARLVLATTYLELEGVGLYTANDRAHFFGLPGSRSPGLAERVLDRGGPGVATLRLLDMRSALRDDLLDGLTDAVAAPFAAPHERAQGSVRDAGALVRARISRQLFTLQPSEALRAAAPGQASSAAVADSGGPTGWSLLPELVALLAKAEARLVIVVVPQSPVVQPPCDGKGAPERAARVAEELGLDVLDFTHLPMETAHYLDPSHMSPAGASRFTAVLAEQLVLTGVLAKGRQAPGSYQAWPCTSG